MVAIFGHRGHDGVSLGWPWWLAVVIGSRWRPSARLIGWLSVRTEGLYTIMITLAIGVGFYYLVLQNYAVFNGFQGKQRCSRRRSPHLLARPRRFYYLAPSGRCRIPLRRLSVARTLGIALQGITRQPAIAHGTA